MEQTQPKIKKTDDPEYFKKYWRNHPNLASKRKMQRAENKIKNKDDERVKYLARLNTGQFLRINSKQLAFYGITKDPNLGIYV